LVNRWSRHFLREAHAADSDAFRVGGHIEGGAKKASGATNSHRMFGVTLKTAWFMSHRIREAMRRESMGGVARSTVSAFRFSAAPPISTSVVYECAEGPVRQAKLVSGPAIAGAISAESKFLRVSAKQPQTAERNLDIVALGSNPGTFR
jgi:hypothetical protein